MEQTILQALVQVTPGEPSTWIAIFKWWNWGFWLGVVIGILGVIYQFMKAPMDEA
ncbi:MAG: hypothetical protein V2B18_03280 [Pseudomonadota bacterium]